MEHRLQNMQMYSIVGTFGILVYLNSLPGNFVHDDLPAIVYNRDVLGTSSVFDVLLNDFWGMRMKLKESHKSYRPLTTLTFRLNRMIFGMENAFWFHVVNVVLHSISSILFSKICSDVIGFKRKYCLLAGIFFAIHPIHTESVSGIVGRAEILACTFFSLSFLSYHNYITKDVDNIKVLWTSILLGGFAMLSKESGLTVFIVNLLYDFYRNWSIIKKTVYDVRWNHESYRIAKRMFSVLVSFIILSLARIALLQGTLPRFSQQDNPAAFHSSFQVRLLTFLYLSSFNSWLLFCPSQLSHDWQMGSVPLIMSFRDTRNILTLITFCVIVLIIYKIYNDLELQRHVAIVLGFILLVFPFLLPASNLLVTVGFVLAERILYIPSMGFCILVLYGAQLLYENVSKLRRFLQIAGFLLFCFFCLKTISRNQDWHTRETLLKSGLRVLPGNAKLHYNYANFLRDSSNFDLAKHHYRRALKLWPHYASAWNNLGTLIEDFDAQESHFLTAIYFSNEHINAHFNLGQLYRKTNRSYESIKMFEKCIHFDKSFVPAYLGLSKLKFGIASGLLLKRALEVNVENHLVRLELADWLYSKHLFIEALSNYMIAIQHENSLQLSFVTGALRVLRSLGHRERMHQLILRWQIMKRSNQDKIVAQIYLRDWSMKTEILRKAQMYEDTIMHRMANDCTSNSMEMSNLDNNNLSNNKENNIKLYAHTLHCNRSGVYLEKGRSSSTATSKKFCDISADDSTLISLKFKSKIRRHKNNLKMRKYKDIFNNMIKPMIAIDKL
ncbi:hypothetical protein PVAND_002857 [Polypedilum vanderplanki]|uniref:dolichyl-phosphate-mannose--protein mannosyltransferase n=1 Tax=Polypedilum vanderplanki TaxID=319348 RepID=A0A9J6BSS2_POLVA|nr:hypothetical protein PVAND_002857 [Polypedilum vanderplanki]